MNFGNILSNGSFWQINKRMVHTVGWEASIVLADLITKREYFRNRGELKEDGSFFNTQKNIEEDTLLTPHSQRMGLSKLREFGILRIRKEGHPAKNYYLINDKRIAEILL